MKNYSRREMPLKGGNVIGGRKIEIKNPRKINILGKNKSIVKRN